MDLLQIPIRQLTHHSAWNKQMMWDLAKVATDDLYQEYEPALELMTILRSPAVTEADLRSQIVQWTNKHLKKQGFKPVFFKDLMATVESDTYLKQIKLEIESQGQKAIHRDGFIEPRLYFALVEKGHVPIGDDHDLRAHLILYTFPQIVAPTKRLARLYRRVSESKMTSVDIEAYGAQIEYMWHGIQEHSIYFRQTPGSLKFSLLGGYSHVLASDIAFAIDVHHLTTAFSPIMSAKRLDLIYSKLENELRTKSPSTAAKKLQEYFEKELEIFDDYRFVIEERLLTELVQSEFMSVRDRLGLQAAWKHLGPKLFHMKRKTIRVFFDLDSTVKFWDLHMDYLEELISQAEKTSR